MEIELNKNYYYIGVGYNNLKNTVVKVLKETDYVNNHKIYVCEDENLDIYKIYDFNLSKYQITYNYVSTLEKELLSNSIGRFKSFINGRYVGDL